MQKPPRQARLSASWRRYQRRPLAGDGGSSPVLETEMGPRCVCSSPAVMWEGEYFRVVTGDLSDRCSLPVPALLRNNEESEYSIQQS